MEIIIGGLQKINFDGIREEFLKFNSLAKGTKEQIDSAISILSMFGINVIDTIADILLRVLDTFEEIYTRNKDKIDNIIKELVTKAFEVAKEFIATNSQIIADVVQVVADAIKQLFENDDFQKVIDAISNTVAAIIDAAIKVLTNPSVVDAIARFVKALMGAMFGVLGGHDTAWSGKKQAVETLKATTAKNKANGGPVIEKTIFDMIGEFIDDLVGKANTKIDAGIPAAVVSLDTQKAMQDFKSDDSTNNTDILEIKVSADEGSKIANPEEIIRAKSAMWRIREVGGGV